MFKTFDIFDEVKAAAFEFSDNFEKDVLSKVKNNQNVGSRGQLPCNDDHITTLQTGLDGMVHKDWSRQALYCKWQVQVEAPGFKEHMRPHFYGASGPSESVACEAGYAAQFRICFKGSRKVSLMYLGRVLAALRGSQGLPQPNSAITLSDCRKWFRNLTRDNACFVSFECYRAFRWAQIRAFSV